MRNRRCCRRPYRGELQKTTVIAQQADCADRKERHLMRSINCLEPRRVKFLPTPINRSRSSARSYYELAANCHQSSGLLAPRLLHAAARRSYATFLSSAREAAIRSFDRQNSAIV